MSGRRDQAPPPALDNLRRLASDKDVEEALLYLRDSADSLKRVKLAISRAKVMLDTMEGRIFASLAEEAKGFDARRLLVKKDPRWADAMEQLSRAEAELVRLNAEREYHRTIIEVWQSEGANLRAMRI